MYVSTYSRILLLVDCAGCYFLGFNCLLSFCFLPATFLLCYLVLVCALFYFSISAIHKHIVSLCSSAFVCALFYLSIFAAHKHIVRFLFVVRPTFSIFIGSQTRLLAISYDGLCSHMVVEYSVTLFLLMCIVHIHFCLCVDPVICFVISCSSFPIFQTCHHLM